MEKFKVGGHFTVGARKDLFKFLEKHSISEVKIKACFGGNFQEEYWKDVEGDIIIEGEDVFIVAEKPASSLSFYSHVVYQYTIFPKGYTTFGEAKQAYSNFKFWANGGGEFSSEQSRKKYLAEAEAIFKDSEFAETELND